MGIIPRAREGRELNRGVFRTWGMGEVPMEIEKLSMEELMELNGKLVRRMWSLKMEAARRPPWTEDR